MNPITYPARPINGGPLEKARPKHGEWFYEPKYNGWRALVHVPTSTMFNRHGQRLSIHGEFEKALAELQKSPFDWLDCEALERRHNIGRGSLIVLDCPTMPGPYTAHRIWLSKFFRPEVGPEFFRQESIYSSPSVAADDARHSWEVLQKRNKVAGCNFYEGLVAKEATSKYPIQLRSASEAFPLWVKHRWPF